VSVITKLINIIFSSYECILLDGATKTSHSWTETATKVW
jgi:hypothetical protein